MEGQTFIESLSKKTKEMNNIKGKGSNNFGRRMRKKGRLTGNGEGGGHGKPGNFEPG